MKIRRILASLLSVLTIVGVMTIMPITTSARIITNEEYADSRGDPLIKYTSSELGAFATREAKIESMMLVKENIKGYNIYYEPYTGEVAVEEVATGNVLFTNPYDLSDTYCTASASTKEKLLSQIVLTYLNNEVEETMYSYVEAAQRGQIKMKDIKNGIRVEYAIGEDAIQRLVPRMISTERFEKFILNPLHEAIENEEDYSVKNQIEFALSKLEAYYELKDTSVPGLSERQIKEMEKAFPVVRKMPVYVCETEIESAELKRLEVYVKTYCQAYTYEELEFDNQETGYVNTDDVPPRFSMALEYTITDTGLEVSLPANGISFDETMYKLQDITILPYMGCGSNQYTGYTFLPDGSGTIFRYEDLADTIYTISGKVYGDDYAYHNIDSDSNAEAFRYPVFGAVTNYSDSTDPKIEETKLYDDMGFLAIITEGDSLATISSDHGGALHPYNSVYATFTPRPSDVYNLADSISVSGDSKITVTSSRKYTDRYTIKYIMLDGKESAGAKKYDISYFGMAEAYRDYLSDTGNITKIASSDDSLPLVIESFGSIVGTDTVLSFPVEVDVPLTTFSDIESMADDLRENGITDVNFKMTGFANGGLDSKMPYKLSWQSVLEDDVSFEDLAAYASENGVGLYPEFDFANVGARGSFDGVSLKKQAVKTIDNRYARKRVYDSSLQMLTNTSYIAISASKFSYFWDEFAEKYFDYGNNAISVSTLGSDLNSDFDEDDPYHREDSKEYTVDLLKDMSEKGSVMISKGNAYAVPYADIITDVSLTSSGYLKSSESVPFVGIVLHGSKVFTGTPINMEGDVNEAILRMIENGASPMFTLSYENTSELKTDLNWNKYYSIAYDIWKDDLVEKYLEVNSALADVQDKYIVSHDNLEGYRVPDDEEKAADEAEIAAVEAENAETLRIAEEKAAIRKRRYERLGIEDNKNQRKIPLKEIDVLSKYSTEKGTVVAVGYEGGKVFILNFNAFDVTTEYNGTTYTVPAQEFITIG